jgi:hypothetical protein
MISVAEGNLVVLRRRRTRRRYVSLSATAIVKEDHLYGVLRCVVRKGGRKD